MRPPGKNKESPWSKSPPTPPVGASAGGVCVFSLYSQAGPTLPASLHMEQPKANLYLYHDSTMLEEGPEAGGSPRRSPRIQAALFGCPSHSLLFGPSCPPLLLTWLAFRTTHMDTAEGSQWAGFFSNHTHGSTYRTCCSNTTLTTLWGPSGVNVNRKHSGRVWRLPSGPQEDAWYLDGG